MNPDDPRRGPRKHAPCPACGKDVAWTSTECTYTHRRGDDQCLGSYIGWLVTEEQAAEFKTINAWYAAEQTRDLRELASDLRAIGCPEDRISELVAERKAERYDS